MNSTPKALIRAALLGLSATALCAQQDPNAPTRLPSQPTSPDSAAEGQPLLTAPARAIGGNTGLMVQDGVLWGTGIDYEVLFESGRVRFQPALPLAPTTAELTWKTTGVARGQSAPIALPFAEPTPLESADGRSVEYRRGPVTETYDIQLDGLKQSFVFQTLPEGSGDLVVHGAIESILPFVEQSQDGLRFANETIGSVSIGQVVGLDANGARVTGSIEFDGRNAQFRLPGEWVEQAQLPIVVDPLITAELGLGSPTVWDETDPAIAYDASEDVYLVVFRRALSTTSVPIRGQRLNGDGSLLGGVLAVGNSGFNNFTPDVANVFSQDAFAAVWQQDGDIWVRRVNTDGTTTGSVAVISSANFESSCAVGGESSADNDVLVVWDDSTLGIRTRQVQLPSTGDPQPLAPIALVTDNTEFPGSPSISKSGGATGNHLIVWNDQGGTGGNTRVLGRVFNRNAAALGGERVIALGTTADTDLPQCDGNGTNWIVAWETETTIGGGDNDIEARAVHLSATGALDFTSAAVLVASDINDDERACDVAWLGSTALVSWADEVGAGSNNFDIFVRPIDSLQAFPYLGQFSVATGTDDQDFLQICSTYSGDPNDTTEEALIAWQDNNAAGTEIGIYTRLWGGTVDGSLSNLGGGCGAAGTFGIGAAEVGNSEFAMALTRSLTNETALLIVSFDQLNAPCDSCVLVANPFSGVIGQLSTFSDGHVRVDMPLPNTTAIRGASFIAQWAVTDMASPTCTTFGIELTDAYEITIE